MTFMSKLEFKPYLEKIKWVEWVFTVTLSSIAGIVSSFQYSKIIKTMDQPV